MPYSAYVPLPEIKRETKHRHGRVHPDYDPVSTRFQRCQDQTDIQFVRQRLWWSHAPKRHQGYDRIHLPIDDHKLVTKI